MSDNALMLNSSLLPGGSLEAYCQRVNAIPMLNAEEELRLANNLQNNNDLQAAQKLIMAHLKFVVRVAKGYSGYGLLLSDLIQEGTIGLMKAVKRYKPSKSVRLATFAMYWIKSEIHEFIIKNWRLVKVATTKAQRKLFFNLRKKRKNLNWMTEEERQLLAEELEVPVTEVRTMEQRLNCHDVAIFQPMNDHSDDYDGRHEIEYNALDLQDNGPEQTVLEADFSSKIQEQLSTALHSLDKRSRDIIRSRYFTDKKDTFDTLAEKYGISKERVRQIEKEAIQMLRQQCGKIIS